MGNVASITQPPPLPVVFHHGGKEKRKSKEYSPEKQNKRRDVSTSILSMPVVSIPLMPILRLPILLLPILSVGLIKNTPIFLSLS